MKRKLLLYVGLLSAALPGASTPVQAVIQNFSFTGNFSQDNTVQLFGLNVGADSSDVVVRTWSYAGGVNAAGQSIASGGFDPIMAVFNSAGTLINQNDDGGPLVPADPVTGMHYDTYLDLGALAAGSYTVSLMQYNNFAIGPTLADGFRHDAPSDAWFTETLTSHASGGFWDVTGHERDSHWAFDILGVASASVPEPNTSGLLLVAVLVGIPVLARIRTARLAS